MEKTAVEFIFDAVYRDITFSELLGIIAQAKIMEKQQDKNKYSEEEVYDIVQKAIEENSSKQLHFFDGGYSNPVYSNLKKWFEKFKKK